MPNNQDNSNSDQLDRNQTREVHQLCTKVYDEVISAEEMARLDQLLRENSAARRLYFHYVAFHQLLLTKIGMSQQSETEVLRRHVTAGTQDDDDSWPDTFATASLGEIESEQRGLRRRLLPSYAIAATLLVAASASFFWTNRKPVDEFAVAANKNQAEQSVEAPGVEQLAQAARLSDLSPNTRWQKRSESWREQTAVRAGKVLTLVEGEIELTYSTGTKLLLMGPAQFVVESAGGKLLCGGLVASVTAAGHGFTIETPNGKIVDLGTEFGVAVDDFGVSEVSVFQGKVEAFPQGGRGQQKKFELTPGRGLQWSETDLIPLNADLRRFATAVLDLATAESSTAGDSSLVDRFRQESLDPQKWKSLGTVRTSPAGLEFIGGNDPSRRPYLISAEQFDPAQGPITITCDFRFVGTDFAASPSLSILTRSNDNRGIALAPWNGTLASGVRCSYGVDSNSSAGMLQSGVKLESDRELTSITGSRFLPPSPGTPYRVVMRDDGVNVSFTVSLRDQPSRRKTTSKTVKFRSLFRGKANYVALEGSSPGTTLIERVEISQQLSTAPLSSYADFSSLLLRSSRQREVEHRLLETWSPDHAVQVLQDDFESEQLDSSQWTILGDVRLLNGGVQLGLPNNEGHIDTWKARPYLLTRKPLDPKAGKLTILGKISFADNFLAGFGASFAVMTRADDRYGHGPEWQNSVLQRGVRANFWPGAWNSERSLEIHEKPAANTMTLLATQGLQIDPKVRSYLFRVVDDGHSVTLTIMDPSKPDVFKTISSPATLAANQGLIGFESCWGSPVILDDVRIYQDSIYQDNNPEPNNATPGK